MRVEKSIKNSMFAVGTQMITMVLTFVVRTIFIKYIGTEYLGINGLFSNILQILSLAELGVGSAIVYSMYEPMQKNDQQKLYALMKLYRDLYHSIGLAVVAIGLSLLPFLKFLIANETNLPDINIYYTIYILNSATSYFFIYKASLINAAQQDYVISYIRMFFMILKSILEIVVIIIFEKYLIYLLVSLATNVFFNITISIKANKMFPFIKKKNTNVLNRSEKKIIFKNIGALFFHRIGRVIVNGTDNIVISKFIGLNAVGLYSNYLLIVEAVNTIVTLLFNSLTASVGNLSVTESKEKIYSTYKNITFLNHWIGGFSITALIVLINPFIAIWIGKEYTFNWPVITIIVLNSYLTIIRKTSLIFRDAMGLFWKDRFKPIIESTINLFFSILLVQKFGLIGVLIGTALATLLTSFWIEPFILYKYGFKLMVADYFRLISKYVGVTLLAMVITIALSSAINGISLVTFLFKTVLCIIVPNIIFYLAYHRTEEYLYFLDLIKKILQNFKKK